MDRLRAPLPILPTRELPPSGPPSSPDDGLYRFLPGQARRFVARRPLHLVVLSGRLWLTVAGDGRDRFPLAGADIALAEGSDFTLESEGATGAVVAIGGSSPPRPASPSRRGLVARLVARLRDEYAFRRDLQALEHLSSDRLADIGLGEGLARAVWVRRRQAEERRRLDRLHW
jgi:hypothetical protein